MTTDASAPPYRARPHPRRCNYRRSMCAHTQRSLSKYVSEQLEAGGVSVVSGVTVESFTWGTRPPALSHALVSWGRAADGGAGGRGQGGGMPAGVAGGVVDAGQSQAAVRFEFDTRLEASDFSALVAVRVRLLGAEITARVRMTEVLIAGRVALVARLGPNAPGVEGVDVCFVQRPAVSFEVEAAGVGLPLTALPGVKAWLEEAVESLIVRYAVEPAREYVDLAGGFAADRARALAPAGDARVVSVQLLSAQPGAEVDSTAARYQFLAVELELVGTDGEVVWSTTSRAVPAPGAGGRADFAQWFHVPLARADQLDFLDLRVALHGCTATADAGRELAGSFARLASITDSGAPVWVPLAGSQMKTAGQHGGAAVRVAASVSDPGAEPPSLQATPGKSRNELRSARRRLWKGGASKGKAAVSVTPNGRTTPEISVTPTRPAIEVALDEYDAAVRRAEDANAARAAAEARAAALADRLEASRQRCAELSAAFSMQADEDARGGSSATAKFSAGGAATTEGGRRRSSSFDGIDFEQEVSELDTGVFSSLRGAIDGSDAESVGDEEDDEDSFELEGQQSHAQRAFASASASSTKRRRPSNSESAGLRQRSDSDSGISRGAPARSAHRHAGAGAIGHRRLSDGVILEAGEASTLGGDAKSSGSVATVNGEAWNSRLLSVVRVQRESISAAMVHADSAEKLARDRLETLQDMLLRTAVCGAWFTAYADDGTPHVVYVWVDLPGRAVRWAPARKASTHYVRVRAPKGADMPPLPDLSKFKVSLKEAGKLGAEHVDEIHKGTACFPSDKKAGLTRQLAAAATGGSRKVLGLKEADCFSLLLCPPADEDSDGSIRGGARHTSSSSPEQNRASASFVRRGVVQRHMPGLHLSAPPGGNGLGRDHWVLAFEKAITSLRSINARPILVAEQRKKQGTSRTNNFLVTAAQGAVTAISEHTFSPDVSKRPRSTST